MHWSWSELMEFPAHYIPLLVDWLNEGARDV
jgi:hypothetical protein